MILGWTRLIKGKHLALAARVTVANGLIVSAIWYTVTLWAGDLSFLLKLQRKIEAYVWAGRSRVDRNTLSQGKAKGGLGLLSIMEQYRAMSGNLMLWTLGPDDHPLRVILRSHIHDLSRRKWGNSDLSWVVTKGGSSESLGSPPWRNICKAWSSLKPFLRKLEPRNSEEWQQLPLRRPHYQHQSEARVQCLTQAQQRLRDVGLLTVADISEANGAFRTWDSLPIDHDDNAAHRAYTALIANIRYQENFDLQMGPHRVFFGEAASNSNGHIWLYDVPQAAVSSRWPVIRQAALPIKTFHCRSGFIRKIPRSCPPNHANLHRILVRHSNNTRETKLHFGFWSPERNILLQYRWSDGTSLLDTSTSQLRTLQAQQRFKPHLVATRWERELGCTTPVEIWSKTWLNFIGASENTFLWQLYYRAIATQKWRFPSAPADDIRIRCTRCEMGTKEDISHCIWGCPKSQPCWSWGMELLKACSDQRHRPGGFRGSLEPAHVFIAAPLPAEWQIPERLWQLLRAVLCWQIWKSRNEHFMANRPSDPRRTIRKAWHRLSMYFRKEWAYLRRKISTGRINLSEAEAIMQLQFGKNLEIWNLQGMTIQSHRHRLDHLRLIG